MAHLSTNPLIDVPNILIILDMHNHGTRLRLDRNHQWTTLTLPFNNVGYIISIIHQVINLLHVEGRWTLQLVALRTAYRDSNLELFRKISRTVR